jgi:hypothetical protein
MGETKKLMFRNQYLLTNKEIHLQKDATKICIGDFTLYFGNDIECYTIQKDDMQITLLGYVFHCYNDKKEQDLITNLFTLTESELLDEIDLWCGHFVLFIKDKDIKIYNDACASFKVFYGEQDGNKAVGSDPKIINTFFNFEEDENPEKLKFYQSDYFKRNNVKAGNETQYTNINQLVANHSLNSGTLNYHRIFPRKKRVEISEKESAKKIIPIFKNLTKNIHKRYNIYTSITAGFDSRLSMAATKKIAKEITYYTFKFSNKTEDYIDYRIPKQITSKLSLKYILKPLISKLPEIEKQKILASYDSPRLKLFLQYFENFPKHKKENILMTGGGSEVAKNYLENVSIKNGKHLVRAIHFPDNTYLDKYYQNWLDKNKKLISDFDYNILDLVHWEQDITSFAGQNMHYAHHYTKIISIFNCTKVLELMLSVEKKKRDAKNPKFYKYLINKMWPELNNFPYNPSLKEKLILLFKKIKIYRAYKFLQIRLKSNG